MLSVNRALIVAALLPFAFMRGASFGADNKMNVLFIICDDLNDYVENFGGHPQNLIVIPINVHSQGFMELWSSVITNIHRCINGN